MHKGGMALAFTQAQQQGCRETARRSMQALAAASGC